MEVDEKRSPTINYSLIIIHFRYFLCIFAYRESFMHQHQWEK